MSHPIIDFDVKGNCDMILEAAKDPPDNRKKYLVGIVRGMGAGKTRCLEEVRRELLRRPRVLPIGITFNAGNGFLDCEYTWGGDCETSFALMFITRCASVLYDIDLDQMRQLMLNAVRSLDISGFNYIGCYLIEEFLRYVVTNERERGNHIDEVVIIMDEVMKAEEKLKKVYKNPKEACAVLRYAVLNEKEKPFNFNTALCISSLELSALGTTNSGHPVKSLQEL